MSHHQPKTAAYSLIWGIPPHPEDLTALSNELQHYMLWNEDERRFLYVLSAMLNACWSAAPLDRGRLPQPAHSACRGFQAYAVCEKFKPEACPPPRPGYAPKPSRVVDGFAAHCAYTGRPYQPGEHYSNTLDILNSLLAYVDTEAFAECNKPGRLTHDERNHLFWYKRIISDAKCGVRLA
ncbi:hypothetical protein PsYK624_063650 [Phanerochaete sordida]|uniref:Uncharacterized protein n=1 Tax=Phanerochaete sordida TaxID=48140 RepID=A0A9P3LC81_9APHY|nr:hypothetical protein PsYK624_063650 [Phanerochaete sordida]